MEEAVSTRLHPIKVNFVHYYVVGKSTDCSSICLVCKKRGGGTQSIVVPLKFVTIPGVASWATSGTTIKVPVKSHLSPACACSTASARRIISTLKIKLIITNVLQEHYNYSGREAPSLNMGSVCFSYYLLGG